MSKPKLYFGPDADERCYPLSWHLEGVENENASTTTLQLAVSYKEPSAAWCFHFDTVIGLTEFDEPCGRLCPGYQPRNGQSGCCKHFTRTFYEPGERVVFNVKTGKPLTNK